MPMFMKHCRIYNTVIALKEACEYRELENRKFTDEEEKAWKELVRLAEQIAVDYGNLDVSIR